MITQHIWAIPKKIHPVKSSRISMFYRAHQKAIWPYPQWILPDPRNGLRLVNPWLGSASHGLPLGAFLSPGMAPGATPGDWRSGLFVGKIWWFSNYKFDKPLRKTKSSFQQESFCWLRAFYILLCIYWDELIGIPYLKCNPGGDCCWVQEHPNVYTREAQKHATIDTLNFTVGMMHVNMMYCIWFHKRLKQFLFTQVMLFYKHAHPGFVEVPDETKRRETPNSIFGDETNPSLKNNFESSGFDRFLFIKFSMVKMGLQLIAWMEFHPKKCQDQIAAPFILWCFSPLGLCRDGCQIFCPLVAEDSAWRLGECFVRYP